MDCPGVHRSDVTIRPPDMGENSMIELPTVDAAEADAKRIELSARWVTTSGATMGQHTTLTRIVPWPSTARRWRPAIRVETDPAIYGLIVQPFEAIIGDVKSEAITVN